MEHCQHLLYAFVYKNVLPYGNPSLYRKSMNPESHCSHRPSAFFVSSRRMDEERTKEPTLQRIRSAHPPSSTKRASLTLPCLFVYAAVCLLIAPAAKALSWIIPGVANMSGANQTFFSSDLTIVNPTGAATSIRLSFIPPAGVSAPEPKSYSLGAGQTLSFASVLWVLWGLTGGGAIRVSADEPLAIFGRTHAPYPAILPAIYAPTLGTSLPVVEESGLLKTGETGHAAWVSHSANPTQGDRTNVAVVFPADAGGTATVTVWDDQGLALGMTSPVQPFFSSSSTLGRERPCVSAGSRSESPAEPRTVIRASSTT